MTDNQFNQLFDLVTKCVGGIQRLEGDVSVLKQDMSEVKTDIVEMKADIAELKNDVNDLKEGQNRIEKQLRIKDAAVDSIAGEQIRLKATLTEMEKSAA